MDTAPHTPPGQERADLIDTLGRSSLGVLSREALLDLATTSRPGCMRLTWANHRQI